MNVQLRKLLDADFDEHSIYSFVFCFQHLLDSEVSNVTHDP